MRTRQFRALVVSGLLTFMLSAVPVMAAPRDRDEGWGRAFPVIRKVIQQIKKTFGITTNADGLTLPKP